MTKAEALWYLQRGATIKHISWAENEYVYRTYGFITTSHHHVVSDEEFWRAYCTGFYANGWELSDPFRSMAVSFLNDETDELRIYQVMTELRRDACREFCGSEVPDDSSYFDERYALWHGRYGYYRLTDQNGTDYLPGYLFTADCIGKFAETLCSLGIVEDPTLIKSVPYVPKTHK